MVLLVVLVIFLESPYASFRAEISLGTITKTTMNHHVSCSNRRLGVFRVFGKMDEKFSRRTVRNLTPPTQNLPGTGGGRATFRGVRGACIHDTMCHV